MSAQHNKRSLAPRNLRENRSVPPPDGKFRTPLARARSRLPAVAGARSMKTWIHARERARWVARAFREMWEWRKRTKKKRKPAKEKKVCQMIKNVIYSNSLVGEKSSKNTIEDLQARIWRCKNILILLKLDKKKVGVAVRILKVSVIPGLRDRSTRERNSAVRFSVFTSLLCLCQIEGRHQ